MKQISFVKFPVNNFTETQRERESAKKAFSSELFDSIIAEFKEGLENVQFNEKNEKHFKAKKKETKLVVKVEAFR